MWAMDWRRASSTHARRSRADKGLIAARHRYGLRPEPGRAGWLVLVDPGPAAAPARAENPESCQARGRWPVPPS